ncbi:MAG TPA: WecB/TagA/CpsF family glycosyltransferase [Caldisericia bacterium]|nr:WecB/TagA/CpsF family glycosyltransferase [Caldisericia bacterium]HOL83100.1 WecB/TagA/CpsF family glycosyltransferase [Caldisericia bacterium]HPP43249.1 WecB/TagA/CpsF family glycosyltransferase [Caldisericia bacterium]
MERVDILGIPVDKITEKESLERIIDFINEKKFHLIVTINSENATKALENKIFLDVIKNADLVIPDGIGIIFASKILGNKLPERIPGIDLSYKLLEISNEKGYKIVLIGGKEGVAEGAKENLKKIFPNLNIAMTYNGYFNEDEERKIVDEIQKIEPDILLVGMGSGKQEIWIWNNREKFKNIGVCIGVGGTLDIWAGKKKRAPKLVQNLGLEWLYRVIIEPKRIFRVLKIFNFLNKLFIERWKKYF